MTDHDNYRPGSGQQRLEEGQEFRGECANSHAVATSFGGSIFDTLVTMQADYRDINRVREIENITLKHGYLNTALMLSLSLPYTANALRFRQRALRKRIAASYSRRQLNGKGFRFAIVASRWNDFISSRLVEGALDALARLGVAEKAVAVYKVPGSFEIPALALKVASSKKFHAVICLGTIIRGQTPHFEYIANELTRGISQAGMETGVPVVFGIITADNLDQAIDRAGVKLGNKGFEAATTAVELANLYKEAFGSK